MRVCMLLLCGGQRVSCSHRLPNGLQHVYAWLGLQVAVLRWIIKLQARSAVSTPNAHTQTHSRAGCCLQCQAHMYVRWVWTDLVYAGQRQDALPARPL